MLLVVGLGNVVYGDDGFGSCLAQALSQYNDFVFDGNAHGIGVLGTLADYDVLVFLDIDVRLPPGAVAVERIEGSLTLRETRLVDAHRAPPSLLVGYLRAMGRDPKAYLIAVGPKTLDPLSPPSQEVIKAVSTAVEELRKLLGQFGVDLKVGGDVVEEFKNCYRRALKYERV
ncbi:hydrogenase maturation protease [Pyrobaculum neutrophilum]|uniref:Hydrogenase maturation protease n=1 Tax=Pyrobaculum neutrophilum (strain DSM 2338 / JCM 9278 / NBRC 100436 / V24Sta) TaxID=444157 RepID=B1YBX2_PYRNV|nr:hydrogenase maturation protease [Pyrobaculum neutrophilum]ACB39356.1 hydrogenase maturation protease [Pyrobaculum neutrophilum V24Sta]